MLNQIIYRSPCFAVQEAKSGMHHAGYFFAIIGKLLNEKKIEINDYTCNGNGLHQGIFNDPVTAKSYRITVSPVEG